MTQKEILTEYTKGLTDPVYIIENYLKAYDKTQNGYVPFKLFPRQKQIIDAYLEHNKNIVTKPRQAGVSTTTAAFLSWRVGFASRNNPEKILILANKQAMAFEFLDKVREFVQQLPRWLWGPEYYGSEENEKRDIFVKNSQKEFELPNKCRVKAVATSKDALRGYTPTFLVFDEAAFIDNGAEVFGAAMSSLGCISDDSLVLTESGLIRLREIIGSNTKIGFTDRDDLPNVCNINGDLVNIKRTFVSEYGITYKLTTKSGYSIKGSWKHPLMVKDSSGVFNWKFLSNINEGDVIQLKYNQNIFAKNSFIGDVISGGRLNLPNDLDENPKLSYLIGLFISEGNFNGSGISITNKDQEIIDLLINDGVGLGKGFKLYDDKHLKFFSMDLVRFFNNLGIYGGGASNKVIPDRLLKCSKVTIVNLLRGMFDGDGCATKYMVKYSSISKELVTTLQILLLNFGIKSKIRYSEQKTSKSSVITNKNHICKLYDLVMYGTDAKLFFECIGFNLSRKQKFYNYFKDRPNTNKYIFNINPTIVKNQIKNAGKRIRDYKYLEKFYKSGKLTLNSANRLVNDIPDLPVINEIKQSIIDSDNILLEEVTAIEIGEGDTYDLHVPNTNTFIANGFINHNTGGAVSLISTPNGNDELYYNTYDQAMKKENNFNIVEMRWYEDLRYNKDLEWVKDEERIKETEYTLEGYKQKVKEGYKPTSSWYRDMCKSLNNDARMIAQELDVSFVGSGSNVIHDDYIKFHQEFNVREPKFIDGNEKEFWIWEEPKEGHKYVLSCDVARGDGTDYSVFTIIDFTDMEQVMEYRGKVPPDVLATYVKKYADLYDAYVVVDNIGVGVSTVLKLMELECKNMHYDVPSAGAIRVDSRLNNFTKDGKTPGFNVSKVRLPMIQELEFSIRENVIAIRSSRIIAEMRTFVYKNGRPDHIKGKNDDCLITLAMGIWVIQRHFKQLESNVNQSKAMLDSWALNTGGATSSIKPENLSYNGKDFGTGTEGYVSRGGNNVADDDNLWVLGGMF